MMRMTLEMAWSIASQREILGGKRLIDYLDADDFIAAELIVDHSLSHKIILSKATAKDVMEQARRTRKLLKSHGHLLWSLF